MANTRSRRRPECRVASIGLVLGLVLIAPVQPALAEERCGWLENPTPSNWWLRDAHGLWIISAQGGPYAEGAEKLPAPAPDSFVATNGHYGYSCACVGGTFDDHAERMTRVDATRALPLSVCRGDKTLPAPGGSP
ncbi:MAG: DUF4087 domain-containing protein [Roseiarcus sp.]|uniref:DUF4087 domain-containing protein n=1 Tax=Roseiarcus sp. TaxID=1969460 RepID=UPI003C4A67EB